MFVKRTCISVNVRMQNIIAQHSIAAQPEVMRQDGGRSAL